MEEVMSRASTDFGPPPGVLREWTYAIFTPRADGLWERMIRQGSEWGRWDSPEDAAHDIMSTWLTESGQSSAPGVVCRAALRSDDTVPYAEVDGGDW